MYCGILHSTKITQKLERIIERERGKQKTIVMINVIVNIQKWFEMRIVICHFDKVGESSVLLKRELDVRRISKYRNYSWTFIREKQQALM